MAPPRAVREALGLKKPPPPPPPPLRCSVCCKAATLVVVALLALFAFALYNRLQYRLERASANQRQLSWEVPPSTLRVSPAAASGVVAAVRTALAAHAASVNERDRYGATPLIWAARNGHVAAVRLLLGGGADPSLGDKFGMTALHLAAHGGHASTIAALLAGGADPAQLDSSGNDSHFLATTAEARALLSKKRKELRRRRR